VAKVKITYKKSAIGSAQDQKDTIAALGLKKLGSAVIHEDNPAIRGMVNKVSHLVEIEELNEDGN
jgi:large subunit ribosomal protein L30